MIGLQQTLKRVARPAVAILLVLAQAAGTFGFPIVQTRYTIKACGCVTPCGESTANCCCSKVAPEPVRKPRCPKCVERDEPVETTAVVPKVKWIAGFQAKQCRGESAMGLLAELPSVPPAAGEAGRDFTVRIADLTIRDSSLDSHITSISDPPPRRA